MRNGEWGGKVHRLRDRHGEISHPLIHFLNCRTANNGPDEHLKPRIQSVSHTWVKGIPVLGANSCCLQGHILAHEARIRNWPGTQT